MNSADNKRWYLNSVNRRARSEAGSYIGLALAAEQMNMRLHDRMDQAYVVDPQSGELRQAAGWVHQLASHSRFSTEGEKTRLSTSVTQVGMDALRFKPSAETNAVAGFYAGGLYGKSKTRAASFSKGKIDGSPLAFTGPSIPAQMQMTASILILGCSTDAMTIELPEKIRSSNSALTDSLSPSKQVIASNLPRQALRKKPTSLFNRKLSSSSQI